MRNKLLLIMVALAGIVGGTNICLARESLPPFKDGVAPQTFDELWAGYDPRAEPLEVETLHEWEEDQVVLRIVRFRIGVFKGRKATLAAVYGYPKNASQSRVRLPGLVQIHGGGQYADYRACLTNAKRGYATVSIAWAGRINAPGYRVTPAEVKLFWDGKTDDPRYKLTTDWGAVDGYHAPGRNPGNVFPSAKPATWTLDEVESPRNSGWFLGALAARRALTFLQHQPQVDSDRLGVYGHSMGGKLTVMTVMDPRVKVAAPSCGGISDRHNNSPLYRATLGDDVSLRKISCPIIFLSPSNDFHGRISDLPNAIAEIGTDLWRVTCSPHHNHQDTPQYEVATMLWMDQHLRDSFSFPQTPETTLATKTDDGVPSFSVRPDRSKPVVSVDVFYTQHGKMDEEPEDMQNTVHRFWHHAETEQAGGVWTAKVPLSNVEKPLWVYANITYPLEEPVSGAGYYYGIYTAKSFNVSSLLKTATPEELAAAGARATREPSLLIESFEGDWEKEWFTYKPDQWARSTHKIADESYAAPRIAALAIDVLAEQSNKLVVVIDDHAAEIQLNGGDQWQTIVLGLKDFRDAAGDSLGSWENIKRLKLTPEERLKPKRGSEGDSRLVGNPWSGGKPQFRNLRWQVAEKPNVIIVMTDDQGYPDMSCHGNPVIKTPNMDRLAAEGVRFSDFHVNPFCSPTRAALLTGRMSDRTGVTSTNTHMNYMRREEVLMPEYFRASGYRTGIFGKWHIGANYPYRPIDRGFDEWIGLGNNGLATTADLWDNDRMNDRYWHNGEIAGRSGFCTDVYFNEAMAFIKECQEENEPFFAYVATNVPHWDWNVPAEWLEPYQNSCSRRRAAFYASISRADWNLGRLMKFLEEENLVDSTILVFLTDNGSDVPDKKSAYNAGMRGFKASRYEGGHRVPCFIRGPKELVGQPREIDALTAHVDLLPTFIDLCGLEKTDREQLPMDGRSLRPLLTGDGQWADRMLVMHHHNGRKPQKYSEGVVLTSEWRLIMKKPEQNELYRIREDRSQNHDVASQYPEVVSKLLGEYNTHWDSLDIHQPLQRPVLSKQATIRLSSDITRDGNPITQQAVRKGLPVEAIWLLEAEEAGRYRFEVRRWPREATAAMTARLAPTKDPDIEYIGADTWRIDVPGKALYIKAVELKLSDHQTVTKEVPEDAQGVVFDVALAKGPVNLEANYIMGDGKRTGAYYVYAWRI